jgi:small subunit ribosomal protein S1
LYLTETAVHEVTATEQTPSERTPNETWFEQFLSDYDYESPKRGQLLEGEILRKDEDALLVDVGLKRDAIVPGRDFNEVRKEVLENLSIGDKILVYVLQPPSGDRDLLVSLSKGIEYEHWDHAERYLENETILPLQVIGKNKGGLLLEFESLRGFLPYSQIPKLRRVHDWKTAEEIKQQMIQTEIPVKVIEVDRKRRRLIFSALAAEREKRKQRLQELEVGQIIHGPIVNIVKFGVFVDLDGVDGLVHISKLDWTHVAHPSDLFEVGDEIDAKVTDINLEKERVSLNRKSLLPSPWDQFNESHREGETMEGRVTNVLDFGAFVELSEGVEGLVHVSEIGYSANGKPQEIVKKGDRVLVRILDIDPSKERISLSMRQVPLENQLAWSLNHSEQNPPPSETEDSLVPEETQEVAAE